MATPDVPEAAHYHPCDGIFCAPDGVLVGWSAEPPVLEADIRADERARVLVEVQKYRDLYQNGTGFASYEIAQALDDLCDTLGASE